MSCVVFVYIFSMPSLGKFSRWQLCRVNLAIRSIAIPFAVLFFTFYNSKF